MTALTTPHAPPPALCDPSQEPVQEPSQAVTTALATEAAPSHSPHPAVTPTVPTPDSLTIGQAAVLTGLHKNTIRAYIKQGRLAAGVVRGKYGQEYRISRAELIALAPSINPLIEGADHQAATTPPTDGPSAAEVGTADALPATEGLVGDSRAEVAQGVPETASLHTVSLEPLVGLMRQLQEENRNLAGQLGFVQAQLQQARETIRLLQAPPPDAADGGEGMVVGKAMDDLEREREAAAAEHRRPWWKFWG